MSNADLIRSLDDEHLNSLLLNLKISSITWFLISGGTNLMNAVEQLEWLQSDRSPDGTEFEPNPDMVIRRNERQEEKVWTEKLN